MKPLWIKRALPGFAGRERVRRLLWGPVDWVEARVRARPELIAPRGLRYIGGSPGLSLREFADHYFPLAALQPADAVLDVGCGLGYLAVALLRRPDFCGRYLGFDIVRPAVDWCRRNITARHPNVEFVHADVFNTQYNPDGVISPAVVRFPCADASQNAVFLKSVFTHMLTAETRHYLGEIRRVLAPGGRCVFSVFLLDADTRRAIAAGRAGRRFTAFQPGCAVHDQHIPEAAVAFDFDALESWIRAAGLCLTQVAHGSWSGPGPGHHQDLIVCVGA